MRPQLASIKQKLTALSLSQPSPSSPNSPPIPNSKRKNVFPSAWRRRPDIHPTGVPTLGREALEREKLQAVMSRLIFQAGVDFETRPMVVIAACALPDPEQVSYDLLLPRILSYLDLYVESDYTLVFLAAGGRHAPAWNWLWKVYRSQLSRKYRKHLKNLYIVHPSFFSKMLFSLAGAVISPKFFRKIQYCSTLSNLAHHVPLTQIDIPPAVYQENLKHEQSITLPVQPLSSHFGIPLDELMGAYGEKGGVPRVVRDCVTYLRDVGMEEVGLFRRSPNSTLLRQAQEAYDRGHPVSLDTFGDAHIAAVLLKKFLRDLPTPIFPEESYAVVRRCPPPYEEDGDLACIFYIREYILPGLGSYSAVILFSYILHLLHDISLRANINKMDAHNLAIVFAPNLVKSNNPLRDVQLCAIPGPTLWSQDASSGGGKEGKTTVGMVLKCCIQHYFEIFDEVQDRGEAIPPSISASISGSGANEHPNGHSGDELPEDEDLDDTMLTLVTATNLHSQHTTQPTTLGTMSRSPPSAWGSSSVGAASRPPLHGRIASGAGTSYHNSSSPSTQSASLLGLGVRSLATGGGPEPFPSISKSRSMISIEKDSGSLTLAGTRRGSIKLGSGTLKGTVGKSAGAAVEALSVTASGFFSPPKGATSDGRNIRDHKY